MPIDFRSTGEQPTLNARRWSPEEQFGSGMPTMAQPGLVGSALSTGMHELGSLGASALEAGAAMAGARGLQDWAKATALSQQQKAQESSRPDLEEAAWYDPKATLYRAIKQAPQMLGMVGGAVAGRFLPGAPQVLARAGAAAPGWIGGGAGLEAGAAKLAGEQFAKELTGAALAEFPASLGTNVQAYEEGGRELTPGAALGAAALAVPEAAIGGMAPRALLSAAEKGFAGNLGARLAKGALAQGGVQGVQEGAQQALSDAMNPDLSLGERASRIVDSTLVGFSVGGLMGAPTGIRALKTAKPDDMLKDPASMEAAIDEVTGETPQGGPQPELKPMAPTAKNPQGLMLNTQPGPEVPVRPLQGSADQELADTFKTLATKQGRTPEEEAQLAATRDEMQARIDEKAPPAPAEEQPSMFTPEEMGARAEPVRQMKERVLGDIGSKAREVDDFVTRMDAANEPELINHIWAEVERYDAEKQGAMPKWFKKFAQDWGVLDSTGGDQRSLETELQDAETKLEGMWATASKTQQPGMIKKAQAFQNGEVARLKQLVAWHEQADTIKRAQMEKSDGQNAVPTEDRDGNAPVEGVETPVPAEEGVQSAPEQGVEAAVPAQEGVQSAPVEGQDAVPAQEIRPEAAAAAAEHPNLVDEGQSEIVANNPEGPIVGKSMAENLQAVRKARAEQVMQQFEGVSEKAAAARATREQLLNEAPEAEVAPLTVQPRKTASTAKLSDAHFENYNKFLQEQRASRANQATARRRASTLPGGLPKETPEQRMDRLKDAQARAAIVKLTDKQFEQENQQAADALKGPGLARMAQQDPAAAAAASDKHIQWIADQGGHAGHVLDFIARKSTNPAMRALATSLKKFGVNSKLYVGQAPEQLSGTAAAYADQGHGDLVGTYDEHANVIGLHGGKNFEANFLHEAVHAATWKALNANGIAARRMKSLYEQTRDHFGYPKQPYELQDVHEFLAEAMTNAKFRDELMAIPGDVWEKIKGVIRQVLGINSEAKSLFDEIMDAGHAVMEEQAAMERIDSFLDGDATSPSYAKYEPPMTVADFEKRAGEVAKMANNFTGKLAQFVRMPNLKYGMRQQLLHFMTKPGITRAFKDLLPSLGLMDDVERSREVVKSRSNQVARIARELASAFQAQGAKHAKLLNDIMQYGPVSGIDPEKAWIEHTWLHEHPEMKAVVDQANKDMQRLKQMGGYEAYRAMRDTHDFQEIAVYASTLHNYMMSEFGTMGVPGFEQSPTDEFQHATELHEDPLGAKKFFDGILTQRLDAAQAYADNLMQQASSVQKTDPGTSKAIADRVSPLATLIKDLRGARGLLDQAPYFHLGRDGDFFVSGHLNDKVTPGQLDRFQEILKDEGFNDIALNHGVGQSTVFVKTDTPDRMESLARAFDRAKKEGILAPDKAISAGKPEEPNILANIAPSWVTRMLEHVRTSNAFTPPDGASEEVKASYNHARLEYENQARRMLLNLLPQNAYAKVRQKRERVQGYNLNMVQSFAQRAAIGSHYMGELHMRAPMDAALTQMRNEVGALKEGQDRGATLAAQQAAAEIALRNSQRGWKAPPTTALDYVRALNHSYFLAVSPAYMLQQITQVPVLVLPEMAKTHGFVKSAKAISKATKPAFQIMTAVAKGKHRWDVALTYDDLVNGGVSKADAKFIMRVVNMGLIDIGSFSREMARASKEGGEAGVSKALRYANATATYAETFGRIQTALAARDLYNQKAARGSLDDFVKHQVAEGMMDWGSWATARAFGKHGILGQYTPISFAFHQYQGRLLEKLHHEMATALSYRGSATEQKEARKFLLGHFAAVTALAGTLGLPGASMFLGVGSKLANAFTGDDDWDLEADYRHYLAEIFGKDLGEIFARGGTRALGIDTSNWGEQDVLPLTKLLTDRRKWEEAFPDWMENTAGAPESMISSFFLGAREALNGRPLAGLQKALPTFARNVIKGGQLEEYGFEDKQGRQIIDRMPTDMEAFLQSIGFKPSVKAEYDEKKRTLSNLNAAATYRQQNIKQNFSLAAAHGNEAGMTSALEDARAYQLAHPGQPFLQALATLPAKHAKESMLMRGMGMVAGQKPADVATRNRLDYSNF